MSGTMAGAVWCSSSRLLPHTSLSCVRKLSMRRFSLAAMALLGLLGVTFIAAGAHGTDQIVGVLFALTGLIGAVAVAASKGKSS